MPVTPIHRALSSRRFAWLWVGQTLSRLGDFLYQIALVWWVLRTTDSASAMGLVMVFGFVPMLIFLLVGGAIVDRYDRAKVMLISDLGRMVLAASLAALAAGGRLRLGEVYAASFLFGLADAFFAPAYAAVIPGLVPAEHLPSANSLTSLSQQLGRICGPPLGAAVLAGGGIAVAFAVNAASFLAAALCVIPSLSDRGAAPHTADARSEPGMGREIRDGIEFVIATPWLWRCIVVFTLGNLLLAGPYAVTLPFLVKERFAANVRTLGWLYAMFPIGYALAAITLAGQSRLARRGIMICAGLGVAGAMIAVFGLSRWIWLLSVAAIVNGFALEVTGLAWSHLMQQRIPAEMLGRVSSIDALGSYALLPVAYAATGWVGDHSQAAHIFLTAGVATAAVAVLAAAQRRIREID